jgi:hypothetical protein
MMKNHYLLAKYLLLIHPSKLREEIIKIWNEGDLDSNFRKYLENCAKGKELLGIDPKMAYSLLWYILSLVFIPPSMPGHVREFYENKIYDSLNPPKAPVVENMLEELKNEGLLNQAFAELFRYRLEEAVSRIGLMAADGFWQLCRDRLDQETIEEIDYWLA